MGKARKNKGALKSRDDPIGLDSAIRDLENGLNKELIECKDSSIINNIIDQLQSGTFKFEYKSNRYNTIQCVYSKSRR